MPDTAGQQRVIEQLADGFDGFAQSVVERVKPLAPWGIGLHPPPPSRKRRPITVHYRNTIRATTFLQGQRIAGLDVKAGGFNPDRSVIQSIIYTPSFLGHMLELTGAGPHDIPIPISGGRTIAGFTLIIHHPGFKPRPHFIPGLLSAASDAGASMRGRILSKRGSG